MRMTFCAFVLPLKKLAKCGTAVAVFGLLFGGEFGEGLANLREIEQRIIPKSIGAAWFAQNETFGPAVKSRQRMSVARRRDDADKAASAVLVRDVVQLPQQAGIVGLVGGSVALLGRSLAFVRCPGAFIGRVARRTDTGSATERVN